MTHTICPDVEKYQGRPVSRVAMTLLVENEEDWSACRAELSRIVDLGDAATEQEVDLAICLGVALEEYDRRDTRSVGGCVAVPIGSIRSGADRDLLERAIANAPGVTEHQKNRLRMIAAGNEPGT